MEGSVPGNSNGTVDTTKNKYYRYVGLTSEIQAGKSKSFSISDERGKVSRLPSSTKMDSIMLYQIHVYTHKRYVDLEKSVNDYLRHMSKDTTLQINNDKRNTRVLGISTTNANDKMAPRKSTSEEALRFALNYAHNYFEAETVMIKLRELNFKHCEGYYSKNANACISLVQYQK